jgi:hypothetical protein
MHESPLVSFRAPGSYPTLANGVVYNAFMATVTISDRVAGSATARAAAEGFSSLEQYVEALLLAEAQEAVSAPDHLSVRTHEQLVALTREGLASTPRELTRADVERKREELAARYRKQ